MARSSTMTSKTIMVTEVAPLLHIEERVKERAKSLELDMFTEAGLHGLRTLVTEEIQKWNLEYKTGLRPFHLRDPDGLEERAWRNIAGYGPLEVLLDDDDVWEIMINSPDQIFVKRHAGGSGYHDEVFHDDAHVIRTLTKILDDSSQSHRKLDPSLGLQDAQLDSGARLHIVHADISRGGHTMVNIRKFTGVPFRSLTELVDRDMLTTTASNFLRACVRSQLSIIFAGAPGAGKTTLLSCCCAEIDPSLRVVIAEEVFEADIPIANVASMQTRAERAERPAVDLRRLVAGFLRMAPDVAIVGEVRDKEALPLLLTLSSGVSGYTTIHAGSARQALSRLRFICQLADTSNELPMSALTNLVSDSIDIVVHCVRTESGPIVSSILAVEDLTSSHDGGQFTASELFSRGAENSQLRWSGELPIRAARRLESAGFNLRSLLDITAATKTPN